MTSTGSVRALKTTFIIGDFQTWLICHSNMMRQSVTSKSGSSSFRSRKGHYQLKVTRRWEQALPFPFKSYFSTNSFSFHALPDEKQSHFLWNIFVGVTDSHSHKLELLYKNSDNCNAFHPMFTVSGLLELYIVIDIRCTSLIENSISLGEIKEGIEADISIPYFFKP